MLISISWNQFPQTTKSNHHGSAASDIWTPSLNHRSLLQSYLVFSYPSQNLSIFQINKKKWNWRKSQLNQIDFLLGLSYNVRWFFWVLTVGYLGFSKHHNLHHITSFNLVSFLLNPRNLHHHCWNFKRKFEIPRWKLKLIKYIIRYTIQFFLCEIALDLLKKSRRILGLGFTTRMGGREKKRGDRKCRSEERG